MGKSQTLDRIKVTCSCGRTYRCRAEHAGRKLKCRDCGQRLEVVAGVSEPGLGTTCPECEEALRADADFCLNCGYGLHAEEHLPNVPEASAELPSAISAPDTTVNYWQAGPVRKRKKRQAAKLLPAEDERADSSGVLLWPMAVAFLLTGLCYVLSYWGISGRWFLTFYGCVLAVCWVFAETYGREHKGPTLLAAGTLLSIGAVRYFYGVNHDMHRFGFLFLMMASGGMGIVIGTRAFSKASTPNEIVEYALPLALSFAITVICLLGTIATWLATGAGLLAFFLLGGAQRMGLDDDYDHDHSSGTSCGGGCGGGGCGGGGCGGCGD